MTTSQSSPEWITEVDEQDQVIDKIEKYEAHRHPARLHRAISVWLWCKNSLGNIEVLLQQRSAKKIVGAGWWGNTVCGNVWWQESYEACAQRRLAVELGIQTPPSLQKAYAFRYQAYCNDQFGENEWDTVFWGEVGADFSLELNPDEVAKTLWVPLTELQEVVSEAAAKLPLGKYASPNETMPAKTTVNELKEITPPLSIEIGEETMLLAPWTVMIILDTRFVSQFA